MDGPFGCLIKDQSGQTIGTFKDHCDAEMVIALANGNEDSLYDRIIGGIEDLHHEIGHGRIGHKEIRNTIEDLYDLCKKVE